MGRAHHDAALQALRREVLVDHAGGAAVQRGRGDVVGGEVALGGPLARLARRGVVVGHQAHDLVAQQAAQVQFGRGLQPVADDQVDLRARQGAAVVVVGRQRRDGQVHARRRAVQAADQAGQEQRVEVVARGDAELQRAGGGVEAAGDAPAEQGLGAGQQLRGRVQQLQGHRGGGHAGAGAHQQRVTDQLAQPPQLGGDRRLGAVQPQGGARDAAFTDHGVEDPHELEFDLVEGGALRHTCISMSAMHDNV